ncbi:MAG: hypothetical protein H6573_32130 [Lewinellaceae bacterium]|nr:hypothetical protein [Phaeodactylibacter sp.]MCB9352107.1 hypothetical protein [Lewinellaceae bacterium]
MSLALFHRVNLFLFLARSAIDFFIFRTGIVRYRMRLSGFARWFVEQQYEQPSLIESQQQQSEEQEQQQRVPVVPALCVFPKGNICRDSQGYGFVECALGNSSAQIPVYSAKSGVPNTKTARRGW